MEVLEVGGGVTEVEGQTEEGAEVKVVGGEAEVGGAEGEGDPHQVSVVRI